MDLRALRRDRRGRFVGSLMPYVGYIIQSGVAMVFLLAMIAFSAWYTALLRNVPADLPIRWIALALLAPPVIHANFRTYLQQPDTLFMLPQEHRMREYFVPAWVSGVIWKALGLMFILITLWPLYIRSETDAKPLWATVLLLAGLKCLSAFGHWRELSMLSRQSALAFRLLRWAVCGLAVAAWLWQPAGRGLIFILLLAAAYTAGLMVPPRHIVPWENLIAAEKAQAARAQMVLGWFVDVSGREQRVYARRWLPKNGSRLPWQRGSAYRFLLTQSFARGDLFGIVLRIGLLGLLLVALGGNTLTAACLYLFFVFVMGVQLSSLRRLYQESFWLIVYPLPEGSRAVNTAGFVFRLHALWSVVMWLPLARLIPSNPGVGIGSLAAGLVLAWLQRGSLLRKMASTDED
ncbi:ABC transporter permease [Paenibacillus sp. CN-4]|uniref:ABC transporter permease n=1 Tax=Paenibacillus nanchangensis TaxID=3348343 RepID=UPI003979D8E5